MIVWETTTVVVPANKTGSGTYTLSNSFQQYYTSVGQFIGGRMCYTNFISVSECSWYVGDGTNKATREFRFICFGY